MENLKELYFKKREELIDEIATLLTENLTQDDLIGTAASSEFFDLNITFSERIQSAMWARS